MARANNQLRDLRARLADATQQAALREQDNASMRERLQRAESQADRLASENTRLIAALQEAVTARSPTPEEMASIIKKASGQFKTIDFK